MKKAAIIIGASTVFIAAFCAGFCLLITEVSNLSFDEYEAFL